MKRYLVTGATGFVGARVVRQLVEAGREVAILVRKGSEARRIKDLFDRCTVIEGDLTRLEAARPSLVAFAPDAVLHLGWEGVQGAARNSSRQMTNVVAAIELYQLTEQIGCMQFLGLGSQAEYGVLPGRIREESPTRPTTAYGAAKLATCMVLERTAAESGRPFTWLRLFSAYGPDDDPSWLIPYLIRRLLAGERPSLTLAEQYWDYLHVDDAAHAVVAAAEASVQGIYNLGSGSARPLRDIVTLIRDRIDPSLPLGLGDLPYRPDQVMHLEADITALTAATGWRPKIDLEAGLADVVRWHRRTQGSGAVATL